MVDHVVTKSQDALVAFDYHDVARIAPFRLCATRCILFERRVTPYLPTF